MSVTACHASADDTIRVVASWQDYIERRHEIALRLLAGIERQLDGSSREEEDAIRDKALVALATRKYGQAATLSAALAQMEGRRDHLIRRRESLRAECDRLCAANEALSERSELITSAAAAVADPYWDTVSQYLERRHETALKLLAAIDKQLEGGDAASLRPRRERLSLEVDALQAALRVQSEREEILDAAPPSQHSAVADSAAYLRRVLAYLEARSAIALKLVASLDAEISADDAAGRPMAPESRARLEGRRLGLVREVDGLAAKAESQRRGEADLRACGLTPGGADPYHLQVTSYLESRSDMALQLIAHLDAKLDEIASPSATTARPAELAEVAELRLQRDTLRADADATLERLDDQRRGQTIMQALGVERLSSKLEAL